MSINVSENNFLYTEFSFRALRLSINFEKFEKNITTLLTCITELLEKQMNVSGINPDNTLLWNVNVSNYLDALVCHYGMHIGNKNQSSEIYKYHNQLNMMTCEIIKRLTEKHGEYDWNLIVTKVPELFVRRYYEKEEQSPLVDLFNKSIKFKIFAHYLLFPVKIEDAISEDMNLSETTINSYIDRLFFIRDFNENLIFDYVTVIDPGEIARSDLSKYIPDTDTDPIIKKTYTFLIDFSAKEFQLNPLIEYISGEIKTLSIENRILLPEKFDLFLGDGIIGTKKTFKKYIISLLLWDLIHTDLKTVDKKIISESVESFMLDKNYSQYNDKCSEYLCSKDCDKFKNCKDSLNRAYKEVHEIIEKIKKRHTK